MKRLGEADVLLICVPTPLNDSRDNRPGRGGGWDHRFGSRDRHGSTGESAAVQI
jgi:hypothetical protein